MISPSSATSSAPHLLVEVELLRGDVRVHRIGPHAERHLSLELRRRASKDETALLLRPATQLREQVCLADPRLALDGDARGRRRIERLERVVELLQLRLASDRRPDGEFEWHRATLLPRLRLFG